MNLQQIAGILGPENVALVQAVQEKRRECSPDFEKDLRKYQKLGVPPHILIGVIIPVYYNARKAACCFSDEISVLDKEALFQIAKNVWVDYGLFTGLAFVPLGNRTLPYVFFFKDKYIYGELGAITLLGDRGVIHGFDLKLVTQIGTILGYPECCIKEFSTERNLMKNVEASISESLTKEKKVDHLAFFAGEFFPCSVHCKEAINTGEKIVHALKRENLKLEAAYRIVLEGNLEFAKDPKIKYIGVLKEYDKKIEELFKTSPKSLFEKLKTKIFNT